MNLDQAWMQVSKQPKNTLLEILISCACCLKKPYAQPSDGWLTDDYSDEV